MPGKDVSGFGTTRRLPAAVVFLVSALGLCLAMNLVLTPAAQAWPSAGTMTAARYGHTATLLPNGKVLVAGGYGSEFTSCELYDPTQKYNEPTAWAITGGLSEFRYGHTATLLPNGKVLVTGGYGYSGNLASCELYTSSSGTWSSAGSMDYARAGHTSTLLSTGPNAGKVLVVGGAATNATELYDPATNSWKSSNDADGPAPLSSPRTSHTATLLQNGKVLVVGGGGFDGTFRSCELYDPVNNAWTASEAADGPGFLHEGRYQHTATLLPDGRVMVTCGSTSGNMGIQSTELYTYADAGGTWDDTAASCPGYFYRHTATLLPNGLVLIAGMDFGTDTYTYNVNTAAWNTAGALAIGRFWNTATLLANGKVLVSGGWDSSGGTVLASAEVFDYAAGSWSDTGSLNAGRRLRHTLTLLPNGKVLVTGGGDISSPLSAAELYDPATSIWSTTGSLAAARYAHTSTLLANGKVLVSGGCGPTFVGSALAGAELYDGANWAPAESLASARYVHTATLLANGQVLVVGGFGNSDFLTSAEVYDPTNESWAPAGNLATRRANHTATLLSNGKVLVAGGENTSGLLASAELFNPATGTWTTTPNLSISRRNHTATLLPNGKVLVAGGEGGSPSSCLNSAEIFDPAANGGDGGWTATGNLTARVYHNATLLPNGKVLVTGGYNGGTLSSAELYDPALGTWTATGSLATAREQHTSVLLANGKVLAAGGGLGVAGMKSSELFDPGLGFSGAWRPYIEPFEGTPILSPGGYLDFQGAGLRGKSEASGGATNNSSTGYPLVQVRRLDSERIFWLPPSSGSFSDTEFTSANFQDVQDGWCLITVFTNGIPSLSRFGRFAGGSPTAVELASFTAAGDKKRVVLAWETYTEKNNVGFHLWRAEAGQDAYTRLTRDLIPARGTATMGAAYSYADYAVVRGREYRYKLEDVDTKGASTFHGPVSAAAGAGKGKKK